MATHWLANGVPAKVVSERLGHASVAFTLQVYGHVLPNQQASAAEAMERDRLSRATTLSPLEHGSAGKSRICLVKHVRAALCVLTIPLDT